MKFIDTRNAGNKLVVLGEALVLPTSNTTVLANTTQIAGGIRYNPQSDKVEYLSNASSTWTTISHFPAGGTAGQVITKIDSTDYNVQWTTRDTAFGACWDTATAIPTSVIIYETPAPWAYTLPIGLSNSTVHVVTNPTTATVLSFQKNGSAIGSVSISNTGVASFTFTSAVSFAVGDRFQIVSPANLNGLAGLSFTFYGTR